LNFHPAPTEWEKGSMFGCPVVHSHGLSPILSIRPSNNVPPRDGAGHLSAVSCLGWPDIETHLPPHPFRFSFLLAFLKNKTNYFFRHWNSLKSYEKQNFLPVGKSELLEEIKKKNSKRG